MTAAARLLGRAWGLRTRLLFAFGLLGVTTTVVVAGAGYWQARTIILQQAQDSAVQSLTAQITALFPIGSLPPSQEKLDGIAGQLSDRDDTPVAVFGDHRSSGGPDPATFPPELRQRVREGRVMWQRVVRQGGPVLIIGTQLLITQPNGTTTPSGLEIYDVRSLAPEQQSIDQLTVWAWITGGVALALAVVLALLAARGVLRPVRELGRAADRLGAGDLTTRLRVRGSDELAGVARTFNNTAESLSQHVGELRRMEADARRFVADVSHELRTPLAAMTAVTDVLDEEAPRLPGDAGQAALLVSQETHKLTRLVNDLIEVSRFDSGAAGLALDDVDIAEAILGSLRARGWTDRVETELAQRVVARLDPRRLDVIIANLVGNAVRHGEPPVSVSAHALGDWLTVEVGDRGPGLEPAVLPHVFDRFYKADTARTRSEGSGLGLAIAWENARLHGGRLTAGNRPGGGALFTLVLPRGGGVAGGDR